MNEIFLGEEQFEFTKKDLPILIHGIEGSGASFYTIALAANLYLQGSKLLFLCGYPMARKEFEKQIGKPVSKNAIFVEEERQSDFIELLSRFNDIEERIIIIKNIELFTENIFDLVAANPYVIISGNISQSNYSHKILEKFYETKIIFSSMQDFQIPALKKYEGFFISQKINSVTKLKL